MASKIKSTTPTGQRVTKRTTRLSEELNEDEMAQIHGVESSSSDDDYSFHESDDNDAALFEANIDMMDEFVFDSVGECSVQPLDLPVLQIEGDLGQEPDEDEGDSDELISHIGSDDDNDHKFKAMYPHFDASKDFDHEIVFKRGMIFSSNEVFRCALKQYTVELGGDFYFLHNDKKRITVYCVNNCKCPLKHGRKQCKCKEVFCNFKVSGRKISEDGSFQLKSFFGKHDCGWQIKNTKVTSMWLADKYLDQYRADPKWKLTAFIEDVRRRFRVDISYSQAWAARFRAMIKSHGDATEQYEKVWDYAATIRKYNPHSTVSFKVGYEENPERPLFQRIYVALDACVRGFITGCRAVIGLDGCHLRGAYTGQILVAVAKDGNNNMFPISFAVVEAERRETWSWFLDNLMRDVTVTVPTFMSDRQKGLVEALNGQAMMLSECRICVRHMYANFKQKWPGQALKEAVWAAARAYTKPDFLKAMDIIKKHDESAYHYLMSNDPRQWSRHAFKEDTKCDMILNNICESFNSFILPARDKPILSLCEWIRRQLMQRFATKREVMSKHKGTLTPYALRMIESAKKEAVYCNALWGGDRTFEVDHRGRTWIVDLGNKTCGCYKWNLTGIPCAHAMACILKDRGFGADYVDIAFTKDTYMKAYGTMIKAMPDMNAYEESGMQPPAHPKYIVQPGRPKKHARKREVGEVPASTKRVRISTGTNKCSNCRTRGHSKRTCKNPTASIGQTLSSSSNIGRPLNPKTVQMGSKKKINKHKANPQIPGAANAAGGNSIKRKFVQE